ncbi:MAG: hypothetical protein B6229_00290 [Spirochaetaceae bacterium 4572_7]|nr:MAG: hypothetical protein B6229_00290 [Spirochaetaceae bacterium 4572_7]
MNNRGQIGVVAMVGVVIAILFLAPILLKIVTETTGKFATALNSTDSGAAEAVTGIATTYTNLWDWTLIIIFGLNVILLLISAFFIDTHPAFILVFIMLSFFLLAFAPNILEAVDKIYDDAYYAGAVHDYLPAMDFLRTNFGAILLAVLVLAGIIMYGKFKYFSTPS